MRSRRPCFVGRSKYSRRSNRPGRTSAASSWSARFVAAINRMLWYFGLLERMRFSGAR